jgi:hypothetical protein
MFKETFGVAILGATLMSAPAAGTAAASTGEAAVTARGAAASAARREALDVWIDTDRLRGRRGHIEVRVREADDGDRVRGLPVCLQTQRRGGWHDTDCERTDWRGRVDWVVRTGWSRAYRINIPGNWRYYPYRSDWFRIQNRDWWDDDGWDGGGWWNGQWNGRGGRGDNGPDFQDDDRRR